MPHTHASPRRRLAAFSLVEVLVFVTVVGLSFTTAALISSFSLKVAKTNEAKILATRYAEELAEWLRGEKEADWEIFKGKVGDWCFNASPISNANGWQSSGSCGSYVLGQKYKRDLTISQTSDPNQLDISVVVSWQEGSNSLSVPVHTVFSRFE